MTLYGISCKDSNKDNICELTDKNVNLLRHPVIKITQPSEEAIIFGNRNHVDIWIVTLFIVHSTLYSSNHTMASKKSISSRKKGVTSYIFHYLFFGNAVSSSD